MGAWLARLMLVVVVALACVGCSRTDNVIELTQWTLITPSGERRPVVLPARFSVEDIAGSHVVLETVAEIPPAWNGLPTSLVITRFVGTVGLEVNGQRVASREGALAHAWRLDGVARAGVPMAIRMDLQLAAFPELGSPPRLSPTADGDKTFKAVAGFNFVSTIAGTAMVALLALVYVALFLFDRRRPVHGWFAVQALAGIPFAAYPLWSPATTNVLAAAMCFLSVPAQCGALQAMRAYFRWPRVHPAMWLGIVATGLAGVVQCPMRTRTVGEAILLSVATLWIIGLIVLLFRELRASRDPFGPLAFACAWLILAAFLGPDSQHALSAHSEIVGGVISIPTGLALFGVTQAVVLGRDHIRSLREAEARVKELEAQRREVSGLNEELRRQIAERSRELTETLARSGSMVVVPAALEVGDIFDGRYRVMRALGRGGMGAVYEVERTRDGHKLALKVVTKELSGKRAARFAREAEIGARVHHENLVPIVDVGIAAGSRPFLVMELVQGGSLEDKRPRFGDVAWARPIVRQIAAGLAELHANRIVHRDLKPGNVLLVGDGDAAAPIAKISDFGISHFGAFDDSADVDVEGATLPYGEAARPRELTETGALLGTPIYMPPEAWHGPSRHASADVFSLGVLAYELLAGRSPFAVPPVLLVRAGQAVPIAPPLVGIDGRVAAVVLACLRVESSERPRAKEVADALSAQG